MRECPRCRKGHWHEVVEYGTRCHGAAVIGDATPFCAECGAKDPEMEETDRYYQCESCGYVERSPGQVDLE